jgi:TolA-binding protein
VRYRRGMLRVIPRLLACVFACAPLAACVTTPSAPVAAEAGPLTDARASRGEPSREDVDILRERVTRLERRLADMDAKLGLLLAQRPAKDGAPSSRDRALADRSGSGARDPYAARGYEPPREEASLGARAVDLPQRGGYQDVEDAVDDRPAADVEDEGEAVVIRLDGRQDPRAAPEPTSASGGPQITLGASVDEVYQYGQARMKAGHLLDALAAFEDVTERAPTHDLADNAMYWAGACHAQRANHKLALDVWQRLPIRFPKSPKVPDALYGMAQSHEALGEPALAETLYLEIVTQYPKAEKVREAQKALKRLRPR